MMTRMDDWWCATSLGGFSRKEYVNVAYNSFHYNLVSSGVYSSIVFCFVTSAVMMMILPKIMIQRRSNKEK